MFVALGGIVTYSNKIFGESIKIDTFTYASLDNSLENFNKLENSNENIIEKGEEKLITLRFEELMSSAETYIEESGEYNEVEVEKSSRAYIPNFSNNTLNSVTSRSNYTINRIRQQFLDLDDININESFSGEEEIEIEEEGENIILDEDAPVNYVRSLDMTATAYCLCRKCCGKSESSPGYGATASGLRIIPNTGMKVIAVDPNVIPLGTKVYVEGLNGASDYGYAIAADTGGAIKSNKIDLYFDTHQDALRWGRKKVRVYILKDDDANVQSIY